MQVKHFITFLIVALISLNASAKATCLIAAQGNHIFLQEGECTQRYAPCSTFKIAIALMGFDSGILKDAETPRWDFENGDVDWLAKWKQPHTPTLWLKNSCVWYSHRITKRLGMPLFQAYTEKFQYGNYDVSGDSDTYNGLTQSWLTSSLQISPVEQLSFLNQLVKNTLPLQLSAQQKTKALLFQDTLPNGWRLYGKTGNGYQQDANGIKIADRQIGWFVGYLEKSDRTITFAVAIADEQPEQTYASIRAKALLKAEVARIIHLAPTTPS